jgi:putative transposase
MPRKKTIKNNIYPYHITTRSNQSQWFNVPLERVWSLALESLSFADKKHTVEIHAFVFMSNHYHLVVLTPFSNIDLFMYEFNKNFS